MFNSLSNFESSSVHLRLAKRIRTLLAGSLKDLDQYQSFCFHFYQPTLLGRPRPVGTIAAANKNVEPQSSTHKDYHAPNFVQPSPRIGQRPNSNLPSTVVGDRGFDPHNFEASFYDDTQLQSFLFTRTSMASCSISNYFAQARALCMQAAS